MAGCSKKIFSESSCERNWIPQLLSLLKQVMNLASKTVLQHRKKLSGYKLQEQRMGYLFILPFAVGFLIFQAAPAVFSFVLSLTNMHFMSNVSNLKFIGLQNFVELFHDGEVMRALAEVFCILLFMCPLSFCSVYFWRRSSTAESTHGAPYGQLCLCHIFRIWWQLQSYGR